MQTKIPCKAALFIAVLLVSLFSQAQTMRYTISMDEPASHIFHVILHCDGLKGNQVNLKMPVWTPGYYQRLDYANNLQNFRVTDNKGNDIKWEQTNDNTWQVKNDKAGSVIINYDIKTTRMFVATPYLDEERGYIVPAGVFLHPENKINNPVQVTVKPYPEWKQVATGLEPVAGEPYTYTAEDFDILYDCPLLVGNLEELTSFTVQGIPHHFTGYKLGVFDKEQLMTDLKKIVEASAAIIGDIPYKHYTFIAIGPGQGGIEHLNNTTISFRGEGLNSPQGRLGLLHFMAHEYFHHYNVKRIRPVELGPFDYDKGSRTKQLWISEGLSVYYEYLVVKRAGISSAEELINALQRNIRSFENRPGRLFQSLSEASYETWSDGPFGRSGEDAYKTISYYEKGPVVGMLFDFAIRHETGNERSLDDVMRTLYREYYRQKNRGFTEAEFRAVVKKIAGNALDELFEYVYTTKELNYKKYLGYAGLEVDVTPKEIPGGWLGIQSRLRNDSLFVTAVDYASPAWNAGVRPRDVILAVNGQPAVKVIENVMKENKSGDKIEISSLHNRVEKTYTITFDTKTECSFSITRKTDPSALQAAILKSWLGED